MVQHKLKSQQLFIFILIWTAYASSYLLRKPIGIAKDDLQRRLKVDTFTLGWIDLSFLLSYTVVSLLFGSIVNKFGPALTLGLGLIVASVANTLVGFCSNVYQIMFFLFISGAAQALCWPTSCAIISKLFPSSIRTSVFGVFGTSCFLGGVLGSAWSVYIIYISNWRYAFIILSICPYCMGFIVLCFVNHLHIDSTSNSVKLERREKLSVRELWKIPSVKEISLAMFFIKCLRYAIMMWLPLYFSRVLRYKNVNSVIASASFEIGATVGGLINGVVVDKYFSTKPLYVCAMLCLGSGAALLCLLMTQSFGITSISFWVAVSGCLICTPDRIIVGPVAATIGESVGSVASVSAFLNGMGSLGTVFEGPFIGYLNSSLGIKYFIPFIIILSMLSALFCGKAHNISNHF